MALAIKIMNGHGLSNKSMLAYELPEYSLATIQDVSWMPAKLYSGNSYMYVTHNCSKPDNYICKHTVPTWQAK